MDLIRRDFNCKRGKGLLQCCKGAIAVERIVTMGPEVSLRVTQKGFYKRSRCSVAKLCTTLGDPMNCSTPGFPVLHHLSEFAQIHAHLVGVAIRSSYPLLPPSPLTLNLSQHQGLF